MVDFDKLVKFCDNFCALVDEKLSKFAAKEDPKAKVRNRGDVVFPAGSKNNRSNEDHYPINNENQARSALSYAGHYGKAPPWYRGSLTELKSEIRKKVKAKYPSIDVTEPKKKK